MEIQNTKKVQGGETECKKKDESSGTTHESTHLWKDCPDNKFNKQKKKEHREEKVKKSENRKKLESTPFLIQITRRHQLSKSKTTLNMMRMVSSQKIKQCTTLVEVLR